MARFALALLLMAASPAYAQQPVYRCVDQNNRVSFSDKPGPGCTPTKPLPPAKQQEAKSGKADPKAASKKKNVAKAPETRAQRCARMSSGFSDMPPELRRKIEEQREREC